MVVSLFSLGVNLIFGLVVVEGAGEGEEGVAVVCVEVVEIIQKFVVLFAADDDGGEEAGFAEDTFGGYFEGASDAGAKFRAWLGVAVDDLVKHRGGYAASPRCFAAGPSSLF